MRRTLSVLLLGLALSLSSASARASSDARGFGLGAQALLSGGVTRFQGLGSLSATYDVGSYRIQGLFGLSVLEDGPTVLGVGARLLFPLHRTERSDFSVGPGLGVALRDNPVDDDLVLELEGMAQARLFVVENVALEANFGLGMLLDERIAVGVGGTLSGSLGLTYFF
jgi:hypothetical protein